MVIIRKNPQLGLWAKHSQLLSKTKLYESGTLDPSAPTILQLRVQIPTKHLIFAHLLSTKMLHLSQNCEK